MPRRLPCHPAPNATPMRVTTITTTHPQPRRVHASTQEAVPLGNASGSRTARASSHAVSGAAEYHPSSRPKTEGSAK